MTNYQPLENKAMPIFSSRPNGSQDLERKSNPDFLGIFQKSLVLKSKSICMVRFKHFLSYFTSTVLLLLMVGISSNSHAQCPNASLNADNNVGCIPAPISFSTQNLPSNASSITWYWSSSDSLQTNNTDDQSHTYRNGGDFEPFIIIYDDDGNRICKVELSNSSVSINPNPDADFSVSGGAQCFSDNKYDFIDNSTQGGAPITDYQWTFGDGNGSRQENPTHTYEQAINNPNIVLQVTDANGCTDLEQRQVPQIEVFDPLSPQFTVAGQNPDCPETQVTLNNQTPNRSDINQITFNFDDTNNTTRTFTQGPNGWDPADYNQTQFTYEAAGTYNPSLTVTSQKGNVTCDSTFTFQRGVVNVVFNFDSSIVTNPEICAPSTTSVPFSHTPDANSQQSFVFGSLQNGVGPFSQHMPPPNPVERGIWSGSHRYPSGGVKSIRLNVTNICGALDTLYRKQAVIEGPGVAITLPPPTPLANDLGPGDRPISRDFLRRINNPNCTPNIVSSGVSFVRRNNNGGFTTPPNQYNRGDPLPYQMVNFDKETDLITDAPEVGQRVLIEDFGQADEVDKGSFEVNFQGRSTTYTPGNGINVTIDKIENIDGQDSFCNKPIAAIDTTEDRGAFIEFTKAPSNPPYCYRVSYRAGDSTVYRPATGAPNIQNMHDTDVYKPNCQAPNLVRFTNNTTKRRAFRGKNNKIQKRNFFYIDTAEGDSVYRTFTNNLGLTDTLYYHAYRGYEIPNVTDNSANFLVNDSSQRTFNDRRIPFDHDLPFLDIFEDNQGVHGLTLSDYLNRLINAGFAGGIDTVKVGTSPARGWDRSFDWASSFGATNNTIRGFYEQDFKDTFRENKKDDLSPWGSDSINYVWNFADPNGRSCTTYTAWASKQRDALYRQFIDTAVVSNAGTAQIPINLPQDFNDAIANDQTRISVISGGVPDSTINTYGKGYDVENIGGQPTLRIWNSNVSQGDSVAIKYYAGTNQFSGSNCNFSTAPAPYHYYDTSGCWQAILSAEDTVTGCPEGTAVQRIFMGPPRADWGEESLFERRTSVLTTGYNIGNKSFVLDSLGLTCGIQNKAVKVLADSPIRICVNGGRNLQPFEYRLEQDSIARIVLTNTQAINLGARITAQYSVKEYAIIEGDTFNIKNMRRDIQQKLPTWSDGDPESIIRRGLFIQGIACQGREQEIVLDETIPSGQCGGNDTWGLIIDSASTINKKPGLQGGPFAWKTGTRRCTDLVDTNGDGALEQVVKYPGTFQWLTNQFWSMQMPPNTYSYDTSGCMDLGLWIQSGSCIDTHFYRNYKYIADLETDFSVLNPDTLSPSPDNLFGPLPTDNRNVSENSSYCLRKVGDTTRILVSPLRDQERISEYNVDHFGRFMSRKDLRNPYLNNDSVETTEYENYQFDTVDNSDSVYTDDDIREDTVWVLCDSLRFDTVTLAGGNTRVDTVCVDRTLFPERVCGTSAINDKTLQSLRTDDTISTGCKANRDSTVIKGKVVFDSFALVNTGGVFKFDSLGAQSIGGPNNPFIFDSLPKQSKLYEYSLTINESFGFQDTFHLVSVNRRTLDVVDTVLTFPNDNISIAQLNTASGEGVNYAGVIEDSSDLVSSVENATALGLVGNKVFNRGNISLELRYKPFIADINVDKPGVYRIGTGITNVTGCGNASNPKYIEVGHYGRFDPEVLDTDNDTVICSSSKNDTVYFYNKITAPNPTAQNMGIFPRYYDFRPPIFPGQAPVYLADDNFWKDPKGVRDNPISDGHQYERLYWDLNGDGYYETKYDIDTLRYVQDLDRDSTFETTLDSTDVNDDGIKEVVPFYVYDSAGRFDVSMKSIDSTGCAQVMEKENLVTVTGLQAFIDTLPSSLACAPVKVDFFDESEILFQYDFKYDDAGNPIDSTKIDSVVSWNWRFNDGKDTINQYTSDTVTKFFTRNDTFRTELKVKSARGCIDSTFLSSTGGDSVVVKSGDTLSRQADTMEIIVLGPSPKLSLQSKLKCQPATFRLKDSSEEVTEWVFDKGNGEEVTVSEQNFPVDSLFGLEYDDAGTYNMDIEVFGQVPNTGTPDPTDSFRCRAPVQDTTLPTYDSNRFEVRVKETNETDFAIPTQDLCPPENIGSNPQDQTRLRLVEQADPAYDSFYWAMGQGDTVLRDSSLTASDYGQFYEGNQYDTFDITLIPNGEDTLCYDTATKSLRITALNVDLDTLAQPEGEDRPRSKYTFTSETEFAERFDWHFFNTSVKEGDLQSSINDETGYYTNAPGEGSKLETDSAEIEPTVDYYTDRGFYWTALRAYNPQGCHLTDTVKIPNVKDTVYDRSNVFTPNGDGTNDRFTFRVQGDQSFKMTIYNRWGNKVYETTKGNSNNDCFWTNNRSNFEGDCDEGGKDPSNPRGCKYCHFWDGTTQSGGDARSGTYFYKITYQYEETDDGRGGAGDTQTGTVTLIR